MLPFLLHAISLWKTYFACDLEKEQLLLWAERNPQDSILRAFEVATSWAKDRRPTVMSHDAICRYITSVLKNKARLRNKWKEVVGSTESATSMSSLMEDAEKEGVRNMTLEQAGMWLRKRMQAGKAPSWMIEVTGGAQ